MAMLTVIYLALNAVLFAGAGIYCLARPDAVSRKLGFLTLNASGQSEFLTVYGGLQIGVAAFFAYVAYVPALRGVGLMFSLLFYLGIAPFRMLSLMRYSPVQPMTKKLAIGEVLLLLGAVGLIAVAIAR